LSNFCMEEKEKRVYPRGRVEFPVLVKRKDQDDFQKTLASDISATGISFVSIADLKKDDLVYVILDLPVINTKIPVEGRVVRIWDESGVIHASLEVLDSSEDDFVTMLDYSLAFYNENE